MENCKPRKLAGKILCGFCVLAIIHILSGYATAEDKSWFGKSGWWDDDANWVDYGTPSAGDTVTVTQADPLDEITVNFRGDYFYTTSLDSVSIASSDEAPITFSMAEGSLYTHRLDIDGNVEQSGGEIFSSSGYGVSIHRGTYNMTGGRLFGYGVDIEQDATFNQDGGSVSNDNGGTHIDGTYNLYSGTNSGWTTVEKEGVFNQYGGIHGDWFAGNIILGTYNLYDGELKNNNGLNANGTFNQFGGVVSPSGNNGYVYISDEGEYNLHAGKVEASFFRNSGLLNYSGGSIDSIPGNPNDMTLNNFGEINLSGTGSRTFNGNFTNFENGLIDAVDTKAKFDGSFENKGTFVGDSSIVHFENLDISSSGAMHGYGTDPWFVRGELSGIALDMNNTVSNISGESGFAVYYNPFISENQYLGGLDYDLMGAGNLFALDGIVTTDQYFQTDFLTLSDTFSFDIWWEMDEEPEGLNFDILFFHDGNWEFAGWDANLDGSSTSWETLSFYVPEWARGIETKIKFMLADYGTPTGPIAYLNNINSSAMQPVPEPSSMIVLAMCLACLVGLRSRKLKSCQ